MKEKLREYIDSEFAKAAATQRNAELREEILGNLYEKYDDLIASGMSEEEAYKATVQSIGDLSGIWEKSGGIAPGRVNGGNNNRRETSGSSNPGTLRKDNGQPLYSEEEAAKKSRLSAALKAIAVGLYIICIIPVMVWSSDIAVCAMFLTVACATGLIIMSSKIKPCNVSSNLNGEQLAKIRRNKIASGICLSSGVALYIISVIPTILSDSDVGVAAMFVIIAAATVLMVINSSIFSDRHDVCDENGKEKSGDKENEGKRSPAYGIVCAVLWCAAVAGYFVLSFWTHRWWITWAIFPVTGFINGIISGIFNLAASRKTAGSIVKICICSLLVIPFASILLFGTAANIPHCSPVNIEWGESIIYYFDTDDSYTKGNAEISEDISAISVSWLAGNVTVEQGDGETLSVTEQGGEETPMCWKVENGRLTVKYSEGRIIWRKNYASKDLTIRLPAGMALSELDIETVNAGVLIDGVTASNADVETVSGNITVKNTSVDELDANSVSARINISGNFRKIDIEAVSADVVLELLSAPREISADSVSGNLEITLPEGDDGFVLGTDKVSGTVSVPGGASFDNGKYYYKNARIRISFETVSGNVIIK